VVDGNPQFVHPPLEEYFTGRWFSRNFEFNRSVLERILFDPEYSFVRDMFDRMLAKDCPLHCAALEWNEGRFESLLERCEISAVEKGGRTLMHIIATRDCSFLDIINRVFPDEASLHKTDCVLQWTPLHYAVKSDKWFIVERLLEYNVDRSGFGMNRQRAQDPDYINPIIMHAAEYGHLLLLQFLCSIGVSIHDASSRGFPTPLHAAVQGEQLQVIGWLIQHGADCNTRYSDGKTPLFHAVTESSLDVVRALVVEGGASVDVRDDDDRTVIDWMYDYASDPKNRDDIVWKGDVERLNEIVNYLQERGVESAAIYG
jgi:ankyrin repeat protein